MLKANQLAEGPLLRIVDEVRRGRIVIRLAESEDVDRFAEVAQVCVSGNLHLLPSTQLGSGATAVENAWQELSRFAGKDGLGRGLVAEAAMFLGPTLLVPENAAGAEAYIAVLEEWGRIEEGLSVTPAGLGLLWKFSDPPKTKLPIYYHWTLSSGRLAALLVRNQEVGGSLQNSWIAEHIASFAGGDLQLAEVLRDRWTDGDTDHLVALTKQYGAERGFGVAPFAALPSLPASGEVPSRYESDWWSGRFVWDADSGPQWNSGALPPGDPMIRHRLWTAQSRIALPLCDRIRIAAVSYLLKRYGSAWIAWIGMALPEEVRGWEERNWASLKDEPFNAELAWLRYVQESGAGSSAIKSQKLRDPITIAHECRKLLAHSKPITFGMYGRLVTGYEDCSRIDDPAKF